MFFMREFRETEKLFTIILFFPENLGVCNSYLGTFSIMLSIYSGRFLAFLLIAFRNSIFRWQVDFVNLIKYISKMKLFAIFWGGRRDKRMCIRSLLWEFKANPRLFFGANEDIWYQNWYLSQSNWVSVSWKQKLKLHMSRKEQSQRMLLNDKRWLLFFLNRHGYDLFLVK